MCGTFFESSPPAAAQAVAAALAEGIDPSDIGEAIALAANQLVLRDAGRPERWASPGKPSGSVHGDSIGVHASDAVNAWPNTACAVDPRNAATCLILASYEVARDRQARAADFLKWTPRSLAEFLKGIKATDPKALLAETESAIRANQQECAAFGVCSLALCSVAGPNRGLALPARKPACRQSRAPDPGAGAACPPACLQAAPASRSGGPLHLFFTCSSGAEGSAGGGFLGV
jgi:hypothetical protein